MQLKHLTRLAAVALIIAWCFDQLFFQKAPGISFLIFVLLCLAGGVYITVQENLRPRPASLALLLPVLFFAAMTALRQEPFTLFVDFLLALAALAVLAMTWLGGKWWLYTVSDYALNSLRLAGLTLLKPIQVFYANQKAAGYAPGEQPQASALGLTASQGSTRSGSRLAGSILLGLVLALPVVAVLAALLAQADPIFSNRLKDLLAIISLDKIGEYIFRLTYILAGAYLLCGVYLFALLSSGDEKLVETGKAWLPPFLGWLESSIVLASVDLLFAFFVVIQFRYFFGGQANITAEGYTYAQYARRGFSEMAAVAFLSLCLFLGLSWITHRQNAGQRRFFSGLGIGLVALVAVILVSAYQRLLLYEAAYGFSRIRTYTHVFMVWVGLLLLATVLLELLGSLRRFALAAALTFVGFGLTLSLINVDAFIARQNIARAEAGAELDSVYLVSLSEDAVPVLFERFHASSTSPAVRQELGGVLACRAAIKQASPSAQFTSWPSFQWPGWQAQRLYQTYQSELAAFPVRETYGPFYVNVGGIEKSCGQTMAIEP